MEKENKLGTMPISKLIINMSLPIIISMLVQALYNIVDSVFVSRVCEQALTAVSLAFPAQNLMIGLATGTAVGVNALMGRALGAKDQERANAVAINGVFLAVVGFAICAVLALLFAGPFSGPRPRSTTLWKTARTICWSAAAAPWACSARSCSSGCCRAPAGPSCPCIPRVWAPL